MYSISYTFSGRFASCFHGCSRIKISCIWRIPALKLHYEVVYWSITVPLLVYYFVFKSSRLHYKGPSGKAKDILGIRLWQWPFLNFWSAQIDFNINNSYLSLIFFKMSLSQCTCTVTYRFPRAYVDGRIENISKNTTISSSSVVLASSRNSTCVL